MPAEAATLRVAVLPRTGILGDVLLVCAGTVLVSLAAQVSVPLGFTPVPISGQTFAVLLVGASLGSIRGAASLALYLMIGLAGAPVYSEQKGGWEIFSGATGGYLVGFMVAAAVVGLLAERGWDKRVATSVSAMLTGSVIIYVFGLVWLHRYLEASWEATLTAGLYPFVPGDILKLYLAALALPAAWKLVERVKRRR